MQRNTRRYTGLLLAALLTGGSLLPGCGWSARDEFLHARSVRVGAQAGDGSLLASDWRSSDLPRLNRPMPALVSAGDR